MTWGLTPCTENGINIPSSQIHGLFVPFPGFVMETMTTGVAIWLRGKSPGVPA
jgi:hypothetical protein